MTGTLPGDYRLEHEKKEKNKIPFDKFLITSNGEEVGSVLVKQKEFGLTVLSLKVSREHRGKGLAKLLLQTVCEYFNNNDLYIRANPFGDAPISREKLYVLYEKYGFKEFGEEKRMVRKAKDNG